MNTGFFAWNARAKTLGVFEKSLLLKGGSGNGICDYGRSMAIALYILHSPYKHSQMCISRV